ncbi:uncharacterized protein DS421_1g02800 [Arachis hypogaea]|nr:uncharacterized protein DS421_1g02800 [Arachis hypogaea]
MKGMEIDIKRLFQMLKSIMEEHRTECAKASKATSLKFDAIQTSIAQLLHDQHRSRSPSREQFHGSNSRSNPPLRMGLQPRRVTFNLPKFDGSDALGWIFVQGLD